MTAKEYAAAVFADLYAEDHEFYSSWQLAFEEHVSASIEKAVKEGRERERIDARLMVAQVRCFACGEFVHNLDPDNDGCSLCRPVREWLSSEVK